MGAYNIENPPAGEEIIWQHSGDGMMPLKPLSDSQRARRRVFQRILGYLNAVILIYMISRPDTVEFLLSREGVSLVLGSIFLSLIFLKFDKKIIAKLFPKQDAVGVPLWMSRDRIMFNTANPHEPFEVRLRDIQSVGRDFAMGSPTIVLRLQQKTVNLISSEAKLLLKNLYKLRPDLEPTS